MLFRILGPLQVDGSHGMSSGARRAILTALLLRSGQLIGVGELTELLWDEPPLSATANLRSHLTGLRRDLEEASPGLSLRLKTHRGGQSGYALQTSHGECDLPEFTLAARRGRSLLLRGEAEQSVAELELAVALWRGPFGQDLPTTRWFNAHAAGLNNARLDAYQDLFTACVLASRTEMLAYRIESVIAEAPYRQRLWELLAAVHCIDGDSAGALSVIRRCQMVFADDLGLGVPPRVEAMRSAALGWDRDEALRLVTAHALLPGSGRRPSERRLPTLS